MVKEGKFYVGGDLVYDFGVCFEHSPEHGKYINWFTTREDDYTSDPFDTPEDALANLLVVLNEG